MSGKEVRIDSFLWSVRIFKSRSIAANACKNGRITINGQLVKPARSVNIGDVIGVRKSPVTYSFRVLQLAKSRMGAKLVPEYVENITPKKEYEILEVQRLSGVIGRAKGEGRPTKKDRRSLDEFYVSYLGEEDYFEDGEF